MKKIKFSRRSALKMTGIFAGALSLLGWRATVSAANGVEYRQLPKNGLKLSTVGIGAGNLRSATPAEISEIMAMAKDYGLNYVDMLLPYGPFPEIGAIARSICQNRDHWRAQVHLGALFRNGQYTRSRSVRLIEREIEEQLKMFGGYFDIALLHYVDQKDDFDEIMNDGMFDYAQKLRKSGKARSLGFSTHSPYIAREFMRTGAFDVYLFSINPAYDFDFINGGLAQNQDRARLYQESAKNGVGIVCMKTYGGGRLLNQRTSPLGRALTPAQCIQYCLDRPAVVSCPVGMETGEDLRSAIAYYSTPAKDRDYSFIGQLQGKDISGNCVYCNHCLPCPANIDIGAAMKYYDLARVGDEFAKNHYKQLSHGAADCIYCGKCEPNCPFNIPIMDTMREMAEYFKRT